jgi:cysteinyl-tRNA synthetase
MRPSYRHLATRVVLLGFIAVTLGCGLAFPIPDGKTDTAVPASPTTPAPGSTPAPPLTLPVGFGKWGLWTDGPHLRGANIYQRRVYPELGGLDFMGPGPVGPPYTQEDFDRLAALGANYVNVSHPGLFSESPPYALDQDVQGNLDNLLTMIARADMFAVISFRTGPGRSEFSVCCLEDVGDWYTEEYLDDSVWQDGKAQDGWVAMWRYAAERYRDNPIVVGYDLMVEPNANEVWLDLWDAEAFYDEYGGTLYDWNQLYPRITAAIREVDGETPILIGGLGYSSVEWMEYLQPTGDPCTVYTAHQYAPHVYTHQWWKDVSYGYPDTFDTDWDGVEDAFDRAWLEGLLAKVDGFSNAHGVPVAINEFGVARWAPGAAQFMDDQIDLFEQRGWNYALWAWEPSWEPWAEEVTAFNFRLGPDPRSQEAITNDLMDVIVAYWDRNTVRPSTVSSSASMLYLGSTTGVTVTTYLPLLAACSSALSLSDVSYWAYQLQGISQPGAIDALANSHYDMLVLEPTRTDQGDSDFDTPAMVAQLKNSLASDGAHRKLVLAYIDIGEAEDWRWYWTWSTGWDCTGDAPADWPDYILACDPDGWGGDYPVAYWDPIWKDTIIYGNSHPPEPGRDYVSAIDEAIRDGFDGIYLDWVEGYEDAAVVAAAQAAGKDPAAEMIAFVQEMRDYARARDPGFLIIQQNAAALSEGHPELYGFIDGIAQEEVWYAGDATDDWDDPDGYDWVQEVSLTNYFLGHLQSYQAAGLPVFNCEYALAHAGTAYSNSYAEGLVPYVSRRSLSHLTTTPPPGY